MGGEEAIKLYEMFNEELAKKINVPYEKLKASVDRYNELVAKGYDDDFHKQSEFLFPKSHKAHQ